MKHLLFSAMALLGIADSNMVKSQAVSNQLLFNPGQYTIQTLTLEGKTLQVRAFENIVYVANPVDTVYQKMNIYIPEEYFSGKSINGYTAATAPIFFPNKVGGYMPAVPATAQPAKRGDFPGGGMQGGGFPPDGSRPPDGGRPAGGMPPANGAPGGFGGKQQSAILVALSKGYVVASPGSRGRTTKDVNGIYTGKAPAAIVDLKAAVRYLKFNDKRMPGDASKIISNGTSAGGALSALLGATGNNPDYASYLKALGAADATDDIFAVSAYCPITNLDHADMAYEWQFNNINTFEKRGFPGSSSNSSTNTLTEQQVSVSNSLKAAFPAYVNSLHLKGADGKELLLDADGNGSFKNLVKSYVIASAQKTIAGGKDLSSLSWIKTENGKVTDIDFGAYVQYMQRMKTPPAFDALDLSTGENQLFGTATIDKQHFTSFATTSSAVTTAAAADAAVVKMMNPMYYIGQPLTQTARHWRVRHGTKDKDTGLAISVLLGTTLQNKGYDINLELPWDKPHSGDYDLDELFEWTDSLCK